MFGRGMVSEEVMEEVEKQKVSYVMGMKLRKNKEVWWGGLGWAGRYQQVVEDME